MLRLALIFLAASLLGGCAKKPRGRYVASVNAGSASIELSYDFRSDGIATTWILTDGAAVTAQGSWRLQDGAVLFDGEALDPVSKKKIPVSHVLRFDGDDLFREDLTVRFVRQK